jgi:hypothetical protein
VVETGGYNLWSHNVCVLLQCGFVASTTGVKPPTSTATGGAVKHTTAQSLFNSDKSDSVVVLLVPLMACTGHTGLPT